MVEASTMQGSVDARGATDARRLADARGAVDAGGHDILCWAPSFVGGSVDGAPFTAPKVLKAPQKILHHDPTVGREDRFRMKLHAFNVQLLMPQPHDRPVLELTRHRQTLR